MGNGWDEINFEDYMPRHEDLAELYNRFNVTQPLDRYNFLFEWVVPYLALHDEDAIRSRPPREQLEMLEMVGEEYNAKTNGATFYHDLVNFYISNNASSGKLGVEQRIELLLPKIFPVKLKGNFVRDLVKKELNLEKLIALESCVVSLHKHGCINLN